MIVNQGVRNVRSSENLTCFVFLLPPFYDSPFYLISDDFTSPPEAVAWRLPLKKLFWIISQNLEIACEEFWIKVAELGKGASGLACLLNYMRYQNIHRFSSFSSGKLKALYSSWWLSCFDLALGELNTG